MSFTKKSNEKKHIMKTTLNHECRLHVILIYARKKFYIAKYVTYLSYVLLIYNSIYFHSSILV